MWDCERDYQKVAIEELEVRLLLGAFPEERLAPQPVRITVEMIRHKGAHGAGGLGECLNYDRVWRWLVETWPGRPHTDLLEDLAEDLLAFCFEDAQVEACRVVLRKPSVYGGNGCPVLEVFRRRPPA